MMFQKSLRQSWVLGWMLLALCSLGWLSSRPIQAHMTSMGTLLATIDTANRQVRLVVSVSRDDLGTFLKLDKNKNKRISYDEMDGHRRWRVTWPSA